MPAACGSAPTSPTSLPPLTLGTFDTLATAYPFDVLTNPLADKNLGDNNKTISVTVR